MTRPEFEDKNFTIGRRNVHVMCAGKGEDVVFLHGWGASASAFLFAADWLSDAYRVTLIDMAGFGGSDPPEYPFGVPDYAADVLSILGITGICRAHFVGHSFGGRVCLEIAAKRPEVAKSISLVDSAGLKPRRGPRYYFKIFLHKFLKKLGCKGLAGSADYRALSPDMQNTFKRVVNYDQTPLLCHILCPTAIFWGRDDRVTPMYMARKFKRGIADSALFMLDGGHFAYAEDGATFCAVLRAFLDGQEGG